MTINKIVLILCAFSTLYSLPIVLIASICVAVVFGVPCAIGFLVGWLFMHTILLLLFPDYMEDERKLLKQMIKED